MVRPLKAEVFKPDVFEHFSLRIWPIFLSHHEFAQTSEEQVSLCGEGLFVNMEEKNSG